ncbi:MAG: 50S ribosomal protein L4 [candidate division FCPU426 bacterium]
MPQVTLFKQDSTESGKAELNDKVFKAEVSEAILHSAVVTYLANQRQGTAKTKTRGEVSGGGIKPWKQKGTGRARQGSIRAPQWKGGGTVWGPQPRDYSKVLNRKTRQTALKSALTVKNNDGQLVVLESFDLAAIKTKQVIEFLKKFKATDTKVLLISEKLSDAVKKSARNIEKFHYTTAGSVSPYELLWADKVFVTLGAIKMIEEVLA